MYRRNGAIFQGHVNPEIRRDSYTEDINSRLVRTNSRFIRIISEKFAKSSNTDDYNHCLVEQISKGSYTRS